MVESYAEEHRVATGSETQPHELLLLLGGLMAILLGMLSFGVEWFQGMQTAAMQTASMLLVVNLLIGGTLLVCARISRRNPLNGGIVAGVSSIVLLVFGGQSGLIAGVIGVIGAVLTVASPYLPWAREA